jgi:phospholipid/cholesterol/gamma-HCH transport system substrate-binding protein
MKRATFITWEQLRVGIVVLVALFILGLSIFQLGRMANLFTKRYTLVAFLGNASGLREGGQVTVAGLNAGSIKSIEFLPLDADTTRNLRIVVEIDQSLREQVRSNSRARIKTMGLLGDRIVDIAPGTPQFPVLADGDTIAVAPSLEIEQLLAQASGVMGDVIGLTRSLRSVAANIEKGEGTIGQLLTNPELYNRLTRTLAETNTLIARLQSPRGTLGRMLDDPGLYDSLVKTVTSVNALVTDVGRSNGTLFKLLKDDSLYTQFVSLVAAGDSVIKMVLNGKGSAQMFLTDPKGYDEFVRSVRELNALLADIRKDPKRYMRGLIKIF